VEGVHEAFSGELLLALVTLSKYSAPLPPNHGPDCSDTRISKFPCLQLAFMINAVFKESEVQDNSKDLRLFPNYRVGVLADSNAEQELIA